MIDEQDHEDDVKKNDTLVELTDSLKVTENRLQSYFST